MWVGCTDVFLLYNTYFFISSSLLLYYSSSSSSSSSSSLRIVNHPFYFYFYSSFVKEKELEFEIYSIFTTRSIKKVKQGVKEEKIIYAIFYRNGRLIFRNEFSQIYNTIQYILQEELVVVLLLVMVLLLCIQRTTACARNEYERTNEQVTGIRAFCIITLFFIPPSFFRSFVL